MQAATRKPPSPAQQQAQQYADIRPADCRSGVASPNRSLATDCGTNVDLKVGMRTDTPAPLPYTAAMRFNSHGPAVPRPLLAAADAGDVVFVCGAGVSLARAGLPTFQGLLDGVVNRLRPAPDGLAAQVLAAEAQLRAADLLTELPPGFSGIATPDRVFGLLEEEFGRETVERTVATILRPRENPDLSAHRTVLRLACGSNDAPRLVTTNFDRLFEMAGSDLPVHLPPKLDPEARGIVKLHGSVNLKSDGPAGDGFVLSGAAFGGAYVADGWAAQTMRALLERHTVVFLGYAADDPPMQYLLEGLKRIGAPTARAFAFQPGEDAARRWAARGVTAIPYATDNGHAALWDTLEAWADRVADAPTWRGAIIDMARRGPRDLAPHERGQVADLLRTTTGAKAFAEAYDPPPAEWICVIDRRVRYGAPGPEAPRRLTLEEPDLDPFALYGLDDDPIIDIDVTQNGQPSRDVPNDAWDGLSWTNEDHAELRARAAAASIVSAYRHGISADEQAVPPRLDALEAWFAAVADEPAALWWWARRGSPRQSFRRHLTRKRSRCERPTDVWVAWERLLECTDGIEQEPLGHPSMRVYRFRDEIAATGWTDIALRRFEDHSRPRLCLNRDFTAVPPLREAGVSRLAMVKLDLDYRVSFWRMSVPEDALPSITAALGRNLVRFTSLQMAHPYVDLYQLPPFVRHDDPSVNCHQYDNNLGGIVFGYCGKLDCLRECDRSAFDCEVASWPKGPALFDRLRLWRALHPTRSDGATVAAILATLPDTTLWRFDSRRDALHVIRDRWADLNDTQRQLVAQRLTSGPDAEELSWVEPERREAVCAWQRLDAVGWLVREGINLGIDWDRLREEWRSLVPEWDENDVEQAVRAFVSRGGTVRTDTNHERLSGVPIEDVVATAAEHSGRTDDFLVEADPFLGFVQADPERAREAIRRSTADSATRGQALRTLLTDAADTADRHSIEELLALLRDCSDDVLVEAGWAVGHWIKSSSRDRNVVPFFDALLDRLVHILPLMQRSDDTEEEDDPDYVFRAINAPAGHVAETMMADPRLHDTDRHTGLPEAWRARAEALVNLPRPFGDHALTIFAGQAPYLHAHDADWVETHLLPHLESPRRIVLLAGLSFWRNALPIAFFAHVRPSLIAAATEGGGRRRSLLEWTAAQLLFAWLREDGSLSDAAFDDLLRQASEPFRLAVLSDARLMTAEPHDGAVRDRIMHLLDEVWPRQAALRTEAVMVDLIDVALAGGEDVPRLATAVIQHLRGLPEWPELHRFHNLDAAAAQHPLEVLTLLDRIAPEEVVGPVYGMDEIVNAILSAAPDLAGDRRVEKLQRAT